MSSNEKSFEHAWIVISCEKFKYPTWRKFSELKFVVVENKHSPDERFIGYLDVLTGTSGNCYGLDRVHNPSTFEVEVSDVMSLKAKTSFEMFVQLDKKIIKMLGL